jgi:hypothetical protein
MIKYSSIKLHCIFKQLVDPVNRSKLFHGRVSSPIAPNRFAPTAVEVSFPTFPVYFYMRHQFTRYDACMNTVAPGSWVRRH